MNGRGWFHIEASTAGVVNLVIDGPIGENDHRRFLAAVPPTVRHVRVRVTSPGGDARAGLAIAMGLKRHPARVEVLIAGLAASAATFVCCAGDRVRIERDSAVCLHDPFLPREHAPRELRGGELQQIASELERVKNEALDVYAWRVRRPRAEISRLMAKTTWLDVADALALGFADEIVEAAPAVAAQFPVAALVELGPTPAWFRPAIAARTRTLDVRDIYRERNAEPAPAAASWREVCAQRYRAPRAQTPPAARPVKARPAERRSFGAIARDYYNGGGAA